MKRDYENILDYVKQNLQTFEEMPLNELDSLVFCSLSYLYLEPFFSSNSESNSILIKDLAKSEHFTYLFRYFDELNEYFAPLLGKEFDEDASRDLLLYLSSSPRYRDIPVSHYVSKIDAATNLQFGAMTFGIGEKEYYCAFRGTDWDIVGWKEDLLLALPFPVAAQYEAVEYLERIGEETTGRIYVGGHSKGGNLAVYGGAKCSPKVQERIEVIFSHDGPGFYESFLEDEGFLSIRNRIQKTSPHSSYVAQLLGDDAEPKYVDSVGVGLVQHYPLFWKIEEDHFVVVPEPSLLSHTAITRINDGVLELSDEDKSTLLEISFYVLEKLGIKRVGDFDPKLTNNIQMILKVISTLDAEKKAFVHQLIRHFLFGTKIEDAEEKEDEKEGEESGLKDLFSRFLSKPNNEEEE